MFERLLGEPPAFGGPVGELEPTPELEERLAAELEATVRRVLLEEVERRASSNPGLAIVIGTRPEVPMVDTPEKARAILPGPEGEALAKELEPGGRFAPVLPRLHVVEDRSAATLLEDGDLDATVARIRELAARSGHTLDRGPTVARECAACSALTCMVPEALERFTNSVTKGAEGAPTVRELERLAAPLRTIHAPEATVPAPPVDTRDELLLRTLAGLEVMFLETEAGNLPRAAAVLEALHDEIVEWCASEKAPSKLNLGIGGKLITSTAITYAGNHARVRVWNRGACAGELVVNAKDARFVAARLEGHAWREEAVGASSALSNASEELARLEGVLHDEIGECDGFVDVSVLVGLREDLENLAIKVGLASREVRA